MKITYQQIYNTVVLLLVTTIIIINLVLLYQGRPVVDESQVSTLVSLLGNQSIIDPVKQQYVQSLEPNPGVG